MERMQSYGDMIEQVYLGSPDRSAFDRSHHNYLTGKLGALIPTRLDEVYPGTRIKGNIQGVVNFEPLVYPIMGNMVYKQESFYIPLSIIWKNAHKFFTGKNGFKVPTPSVSPRDVFVAYNVRGFLPFDNFDDLNDYLPAIQPSEYTDDFTTFIFEYTGRVFEYFDSYRDRLIEYGIAHGMADLIQPLVDLIDEYFTGNYVTGDSRTVFTGHMYNQLWSDVSNSITDNDAEYKILCNFMSEYYSFLFGPSSMIDYIGFPCFTEWYKLFNDVYEFISGISTTPYEPYVNLGNLFSQISLCWLPFRAAYVCWYWNYRDQLLELDCIDPESDLFMSDTVSHDEIIELTFIRYRCWYKDTFTTALTHTGDGNLGVPVINSNDISSVSSTGYEFFDSLGHTMDYVNNYDEALQMGASICQLSIGNLVYKVPMNYFGQQNSVNGNAISGNGSGFLSLDLFERVKRLQKFVQKKLILGYEYDDVVWSSFLVKLSNVRMRIPELLGRGRDLVEMNTVVNNTNTAEQIAGDKSAVAWAQGRQSDINYFSEEHGYFMSFMTILPMATYSGGMQRLWLKREQFDYMWPEFATMGMDAVYNCELAAPTGVTESNSVSPGLTDEQAMSVFGYQGRYYDLKTRQDEEHGRLRTDLSYLTFARRFDRQNLPKLNYTFVHCHPSLDMFVVDDNKQDIFRADIFHNLDFEERLPVPSDFV